MCLISKVMPLKLFVDMVPSSSADVTDTLCAGCFRGGSVYVVSLRSFERKAKLTTLWGDVFFDSLIKISMKASVLGML